MTQSLWLITCIVTVEKPVIYKLLHKLTKYTKCGHDLTLWRRISSLSWLSGYALVAKALYINTPAYFLHDFEVFFVATFVRRNLLYENL